MSTFAFDPEGKLHVIVELCPEREEALSECVGAVAGYSVDDAPTKAFVDEGRLHLIVELRPERNAVKSRQLDGFEYVMTAVRTSPSVTTYTYEVGKPSTDSP